MSTIRTWLRARPLVLLSGLALGLAGYIVACVPPDAWRSEAVARVWLCLRRDTGGGNR